MKIMKCHIYRVLAVFLLLALILGGCTHNLPPAQTNPSCVPTDITSQPTTGPTQPTTFPTEPSTQPSTQPETTPTKPVTLPTEPSTTPTQPTTAPATEPDFSTSVIIGPEISGLRAKRAFVYDCETKNYLYMKSEADARMHPASITKLLTVYTAMQILDLDTVITYDKGMKSLVAADTSCAGMKVGDSINARSLIYASLIRSASDASHALAVFAARQLTDDPKLDAQKAEDRFAEEMNRYARSMGMVNSNFTNCDGYTAENHYSCLSDIVTLSTVCMEIPLIMDAVKLPSFEMVFTDGSTIVVNNTNYLLLPDSKYYQKEAIGMKTGTTNAAGACVVSLFYVNGQYLLIGVFQSTSNTVRYVDAIKLYNAFKDVLLSRPNPNPEPELPSDPTEPSSEPSTEVTQPTSEPSTGESEPSSEPTEPSEP